MDNHYLITGASGFLGKYILDALKKKGEVDTLGRSMNNQLVYDLGKESAVIPKKYKAIVHVAGKAHMIPKNEEEEKDFYEVNYEGTKRLVEDIKPEFLPSNFVFISTVAVYGLDVGEEISEDYDLEPTTAYGKSKLKAEIYLKKWATEKGVHLQILRLPLLVGSQPPGNLKAMIEGVKTGKFAIVGGGDAKRSMVFAKDVASFIAEYHATEGTFNLTDGNHPDFKSIAYKIKEFYGGKSIKNIPLLVAFPLAIIGDLIEKVANKSFPFNSNRLSKMTSSLTFSDAKARKIGWTSHSILDNFNQFMSQQ